MRSFYTLAAIFFALLAYSTPVMACSISHSPYRGSFIRQLSMANQVFIVTPVVSLSEQWTDFGWRSGSVTYKAVQTLKGEARPGVSYGQADFWGEKKDIYIESTNGTRLINDAACQPGFSAVARYYLVIAKGPMENIYLTRDEVMVLGNGLTDHSLKKTIVTATHHLLEIIQKTPDAEERLVELTKLYMAIRTDMKPHNQKLVQLIEEHLYNFVPWLPSSYLVAAYSAIKEGHPIEVKSESGSVYLHNPVLTRPINPPIYANCSITYRRRSLSAKDKADCKRHQKSLYLGKIIGALSRAPDSLTDSLLPTIPVQDLDSDPKGLFFRYFAKNGVPQRAINIAEESLKNIFETGTPPQIRGFLDRLTHIKRHHPRYNDYCGHSAHGPCEENDRELWEIMPEIRRWWPKFIIEAEIRFKQLNSNIIVDFSKYHRELWVLRQSDDIKSREMAFSLGHTTN